MDISSSDVVPERRYLRLLIGHGHAPYELGAVPGLLRAGFVGDAVLAVASPVLRRLPRVSVTSGVMRYSADAWRVVQLARQEAVRIHNHYIGTEHILLGLISEGQNAAVEILKGRKINPDAIREQVEEIVAEEDDDTVAVRIGGDIATDVDPRPYVTSRAMRVLELSRLEALRVGAEQIGAEHILLGLIREGEGVAAQVLVGMGADLNRVRRQLG